MFYHLIKDINQIFFVGCDTHESNASTCMINFCIDIVVRHQVASYSTIVRDHTWTCTCKSMHYRLQIWIQSEPQLNWTELSSRDLKHLYLDTFHNVSYTAYIAYNTKQGNFQNSILNTSNQTCVVIVLRLLCGSKIEVIHPFGCEIAHQNLK